VVRNGSTGHIRTVLYRAGAHYVRKLSIRDGHRFRAREPRPRPDSGGRRVVLGSICRGSDTGHGECSCRNREVLPAPARGARSPVLAFGPSVWSGSTQRRWSDTSLRSGGGRESNPPASFRPPTDFEGMSDARLPSGLRPASLSPVAPSQNVKRLVRPIRLEDWSGGFEDLSGHHPLDGNDNSDPSSQSWMDEPAMCTWSEIGGSRR
jgi:hypothetical protein